MATIQIPKDFSEFLNLLNSNEAEYLLVGGYAVGCHGYPRATQDLDIWVHRTVDNARRVFQALREFGFTPDSSVAALLEKQDQILRMGIPPLRIELLTTISGVQFEDCYPRRVSYDLEGLHIDLIGLDDLKKNKKASGRLRDLADLESLS